jgi:xylonate dehydratase
MCEHEKVATLAEILPEAATGGEPVITRARGPEGRLPFTEEMLRQDPSGNLFGWSQNAGMGWDPSKLGSKEVLILSTLGGIRGANGEPIALGYHTGHWEVGLLVAAAAAELKTRRYTPFAGFCTDPCDGRTQGTTGMMDSLPYRNDAAIVLRRLIRSLPTRSGVLGVATCDKGLPAMMMALAGVPELPGVLIPGGVTLPSEGGEDAAVIQSIGARFAHGVLSLDQAAKLACHVCGSPGGGCQFLGTAATSQVVAESLGMAVPHSALAPSGQPIWLEIARRSARALTLLESRGISMGDIITREALRNSMVVHAAFGGSTNLLLHVPAIAHARGLPRPLLEDWIDINRSVPRLVDALPNGPRNHPTIRVFLAGGVPEVMLHLRREGLLDERCLTAAGEPLGKVLDWWSKSSVRTQVRGWLQRSDSIAPDEVIMSVERAAKNGLASTVTFPCGNLAPEGSVIKSTAIDPTVVDADGTYRAVCRARVFTTEREAIAAIKGQAAQPIRQGDVIVLICRGPMGAGMEETYQVTAALRYLAWGKHVAVLTDGRFSGISTGACVGHISPEALAGGPIGKVIDGDMISILVDRVRLEGSIDLVGHGEEIFGPEEGARVLARRKPRPDLRADARLPDDTRLWAVLQSASGGAWGGCVYDAEAIATALRASSHTGGE